MNLRLLRRHGYLLLLLVVVGALMLAMTDSEFPYLREGAITGLMAMVFVTVFDRLSYRIFSLVAGIVVLAALWLMRVVPAAQSRQLELLIHLGAVLFLALAVSMVLRHLFERRAVRIDDILGTLCGYLLAAMAWANLYAAVSLLHPDAFYVQGTAHPSFDLWHEREALFLYFSLTTITTIGYGDVTPLAPFARSAAMLEGIFGQFYIAVVVAQLVGSKLAEASARDERR
ncbi:MAG TPA: potassium channel family protein [Burkholderiaceae bacterium]|nr:potassium channel family protein [Burkholderiaceae bacterium]